MIATVCAGELFGRRISALNRQPNFHHSCLLFSRGPSIKPVELPLDHAGHVRQQSLTGRGVLSLSVRQSWAAWPALRRANLWRGRDFLRAFVGL
jgi:hypothetical protein